MITVNRRELALELVAAVREDAKLRRSEQLAVLGATVSLFRYYWLGDDPSAVAAVVEIVHGGQISRGTTLD